MTLFIDTKTHLITTALIAALWLTAPRLQAHGEDNLEAVAQAFLSCVDTQVAQEKTQSDPQVAKILAACEPAYQAYLHALPQSFRAQTTEAVQANIQHALSQ